MKVSDHNTEEPTTRTISHISWFWVDKPTLSMGDSSTSLSTSVPAEKKPAWDLLWPIRRWLANVDVCDRTLAHRLCRLIPAQCPFERDFNVLGRTLFHIPPLCKLNPLYEEIVTLRFRALCYLADVCGDDITPYY